MILLLLLSFCGGSSAPVSDDISSETQETPTQETPTQAPVSDDISSETQETQETPTQSPVNKEIAWGVTTNQPVVYAAADVTQEHIDVTVEWVNNCLLYTSPSPRDS